MNILASSKNNKSFYSMADFFVPFTRLSERNVSLQKEKSNVSSRWIGVKCFSRRYAYCSLSRCWSQKLTLYSVKNYYYFFKTAVGDATSRRKKKTGCSRRFECLISYWLTQKSLSTYVRSVGRSVGRKWRHNQRKISRTDLPKSLINIAELRYNSDRV